MKFDIVYDKKGTGSHQKNMHDLDPALYEKFFSAVKEWLKVYGLYCTKPDQMKEIFACPEFKALIKVYEQVSSSDQKAIQACMLDEVNMGKGEHLLTYYGCTREIPQDYTNVYMDMLGALPKIAPVIEEVLGE